MKLQFYRQSLEKSSNIKCHEDPSSRSRVVTCERTEGQTDLRTDLTKLIVAFRNFAKASKNRYFNSGVPHKVCHTAGCYCTSYFEYKHYINIFLIINRYTVTMILKFQNTALSSFRLWQTLLSRNNFSPEA